MKELLERLMGSGSSLQLSLHRGRCGWILTTPLPLPVVRARSTHFCTRVVPIHQAPERSRFLVEPSWPLLGDRLSQLKTSAPASFLDPVRTERLRRLQLCSLFGACPRAHPRSGVELFRRLALRLAETGGERGGEALWRHLASDFDALWSTVPLFALPLTPFQKQVLNSLRCLDPGLKA